MLPESKDGERDWNERAFMMLGCNGRMPARTSYFPTSHSGEGSSFSMATLSAYWLDASDASAPPTRSSTDGAAIQPAESEGTTPSTAAWGSSAMVGTTSRPAVFKASVRLSTESLSEATRAAAAACHNHVSPPLRDTKLDTPVHSGNVLVFDTPARSECRWQPLRHARAYAREKTQGGGRTLTSSATVMAVSTLRLAARRWRRRTSTSVTFLITTFSSVTPAAVARPCLNCVRFAVVNSAAVAIGRLTDIRTLLAASLHSCGNGLVEPQPTKACCDSHSATEAVISPQHPPAAKQSATAGPAVVTAAHSASVEAGSPIAERTSFTHICASAEHVGKQGPVTEPSSSDVHPVMQALGKVHASKPAPIVFQYWTASPQASQQA
mmetsp:Transcript_26187/g.62023  ORF Transcript_26187/g.62023 Transcript_26187/m.62023 type:complete len:381 (-) Transcript_26187:1375-2517(-)